MAIDSNVEDVNEITKKLTVSIPADLVSKEFDDAIGQVARSATIKGFRRGKAPISMVKKLHGSRIRMEITSKLISSSLGDLVKEHEINMVGSPEIDVAQFEEGEEIKYTANVYLYPQPKIKDYDSFSVEVESQEVTDEQVDQVIDQLRGSKATSKPLDFRNKAETGDIIDALLAVEVEGDEKAAAEPLIIGLGEGALPEELEAGIPGMEVGETKDIEGSIPDSHPNEALRGKKATYSLTLNALMEKVLPEVNDEFAKGLNMEAETLLELRMKIREQLTDEAEKQQKTQTHAAILDALLEKNEFLVPQVIVDEEIRHFLIRSGVIDPNKMNVNEVDVAPFRDHLDEVARKRVRTSVAVDRIAEQEKISIEEADLEEHFKVVAEENGLQPEDVKKFFTDDYRMANLNGELRANKVLDLLEGRTKVKFVTPKDEADEKEKEKSEPAKKAKSKSTKAKASSTKPAAKKSKAKSEKKEG